MSVLSDAAWLKVSDAVQDLTHVFRRMSVGGLCYSASSTPRRGRALTAADKRAVSTLLEQKHNRVAVLDAVRQIADLLQCISITRFCYTQADLTGFEQLTDDEQYAVETLLDMLEASNT